MTNLFELLLGGNVTLTELNLAEADMSSLDCGCGLDGNVGIRRVSVKNAVLDQDSLRVLVEGGIYPDLSPFNATPLAGIGELPGITDLDLSGIDFVDITDLSPLSMMDHVTDLWLVGTTNLDALQLDALLDELDAMQATDVEGVLYMTPADYDAFNAAGDGRLEIWNGEPGHHVELVPEPDCDHSRVGGAQSG